MPSPYLAALLDLDGTLTTVPSFWQLLHEELSIWHGDADRYQEQFRNGSIDYSTFCRLDAERWRGRRVADLKAIADRVALRSGSRRFIRFLRQQGLKIGLISTGLTLLAERVHHELNLDFTIANRLVDDDGILTGEVKINVEHGRKDEAVELFCNQFGIPPRSVLSVGDSEGDVSMFKAVGYSIAFNPRDSEVTEAANVICQGESLLNLLPYLPPEITEPGSSIVH